MNPSRKNKTTLKKNKKQQKGIGKIGFIWRSFSWKLFYPGKVTNDFLNWGQEKRSTLGLNQVTWSQVLVQPGSGAKTWWARVTLCTLASISSQVKSEAYGTGSFYSKDFSEDPIIHVMLVLLKIIWSALKIQECIIRTDSEPWTH